MNSNQTNPLSDVELEVIRASEITPKEIKWLWYPYIPFGKVTLLQGDPGTAYTLQATSGVSSITNLLKGTLEITTAPDGCFVLANKTDGFGFYPAATGLQIPARKAYLPSTVSAARMLTLAAEATGISIVEAEHQNQQIIYTLQGTRAGSLHRGLYIQNGKKIIIK